MLNSSYRHSVLQGGEREDKAMGAGACLKGHSTNSAQTVKISFNTGQKAE